MEEINEHQKELIKTFNRDPCYLFEKMFGIKLYGYQKIMLKMLAKLHRK